MKKAKDLSKKNEGKEFKKKSDNKIFNHYRKKSATKSMMLKRKPCNM
jgi:hypothetical protein